MLKTSITVGVLASAFLLGACTFSPVDCHSGDAFCTEAGPDHAVSNQGKPTGDDHDGSGGGGSGGGGSGGGGSGGGGSGGGGSGGGDGKPGHGYGDKNHNHSGPPGLSKDHPGKGKAKGKSKDNPGQSKK